jgi:Secretion system C-terminal sorting domain
MSVFLFLVFYPLQNELFAQKIAPVKFNFRQLAEKESAQTYRKQGEAEIDGGWRYLHGNMPFPKGAKITIQKPIIHPNVPTTPEIASPPPQQSFLGHIDPIDLIPPDCDGIVGLNNVVTATNEYVIVHAKIGGAVLSQVTYANFFDTPGMSDPYMQYDPYNDRYWLSGISTTTPNKVFIAVTATSDPLGNWYRYSFTPNSSDGTILLDHPYIGLDNRLVVVTGRKFLNGTTFTGPILFCFDKASLEAGDSLTFGTNAQTIEKTVADGDVPCPVSAFNLSTPSTAFWIVQEWSGANSAIRLSNITGNIPNLTWNTTSAFYPTGGSPWSDADLGNLAPQEDESRLIACNDSRISSAQMVNGNIWCAHHIGLPASSVSHTAVQWWELSTSGAVLQRGRIDDPSGAISRYYPTIAVNQTEDVLIGYTISSRFTHINAAYSTRTPSTPADTTDNEYVFKGGISTYWKDYGSGRARWGDYSHTCVDPATGDLWTIQQYADQRLSSADNDSRYGVWWAQVSFTTYTDDASLAGIQDPNSTTPYCTNPINPMVTIRNLGSDTLKTVTIGLILDGTNIGTTSITGLDLPLYGTQQVPAPIPLNPAPGNHILEAYTMQPNGVADQRTYNDTTEVSFSVLPVLAVPNIEGFEDSIFPPPDGWTIYNPDGAITWQRTTAASESGVASMYLDAFDYSATGAIDIMQSPKISTMNVDSVKIKFEVAYAQYNASTLDSLEIVYSTDCGNTWIPTSYAKGGPGLATNGGSYVTYAFVPNSHQWREDSVSIPTCNIKAPNILIGIKAIDDYGNNIYIDNFSISVIKIQQDDAGIVSIIQPTGTLCTNTFTPQVVLANYGNDTLTNVTINYQIDNGPIGTFNYTGNLPRCSTETLLLNSITADPGNHILTIYTSNPNGVPDQAPSNDTAKEAIAISPLVSSPVFQGFETDSFPPTNWVTQIPVGSLSWQRTTVAAATGSASMVINNFNYPTGNTIANFISPVVQFDPVVDSFFVSFDYAYSQGATFPGSTSLPLDTLDIQLTQDCGNTFTSIWKKWGGDLQTIGDSTGQVTTAFVPTSSQWKHVNIYLSPKIGSQNFQLYFTARSNHQNNLYIDNINIYTKTVPAALKEQGYLIYPNPFTNSITVRNYRVPVDLQYIAIYNSVGQLVWSEELDGMGYTEMPVNLSNLATGVYIVKLGYTDKTVLQKIVKQ